MCGVDAPLTTSGCPLSSPELTQVLTICSVRRSEMLVHLRRASDPHTRGRLVAGSPYKRNIPLSRPWSPTPAARPTVNRRRGHFDAGHRLAVGIDHATALSRAHERARYRRLLESHPRSARTSCRREPAPPRLVSDLRTHESGGSRARSPPVGRDDVAAPGSAVNSYRPSAPAVTVCECAPPGAAPRARPVWADRSLYQ